MSTRNTHNRTYRSPAAGAGGPARAAAISHLPELLRWIIILGEREGLSIGEIARLAGTSREAIKSMQRRGLVLIRNELVIPPGVVS